VGKKAAIERGPFVVGFVAILVGIAVVPLLVGALLGVSAALAADPRAATSTYGRPAVASADPRPVDGSDTYSAKIFQELQFVRTQNRWVLGGIGGCTLLLVVVLGILVVTYAKKASKMKFAFGFLEFEVQEATRAAEERFEAADKVAKEAVRILDNTFGLVQRLRVSLASTDRKPYVAFLKHCCEEVADSVNRAGTVRASIWIRDGEGLRIVAGYRVSDATIKTMRLSDDSKGFAWEVLTAKKTQVVDSRAQPERIAPDPNSDYKIVWMAGVPIWTNEVVGEVGGVLCISDDVEESMGQEELKLCRFYANLAAPMLIGASVRGVALLE
jgi:hypothetical protein